MDNSHKRSLRLEGAERKEFCKRPVFCPHSSTSENQDGGTPCVIFIQSKEFPARALGKVGKILDYGWKEEDIQRHFDIQNERLYPYFNIAFWRMLFLCKKWELVQLLLLRGKILQSAGTSRPPEEKNAGTGASQQLLSERSCSLCCVCVCVRVQVYVCKVRLLCVSCH